MNKKLHTLFEGLHTFLILWVTQSFSALGSSMTSYALVVWSYQQKGSALTTALLSICSYAPYVLLSIFAGALSDRWNKKRTMLVCDSFAAATTLLILILLKTVKKELHSIVHPRSIRKIQFDGHAVEHEVLRAVNVFLTVYMTIFALSLLLVSVDEYSLETNFSAVAATLNNIGPGLDQVGPMSNFSCYSPFSKLVLIFDMLAGRLELFPMLILFYPSTWKKRG